MTRKPALTEEQQRYIRFCYSENKFPSKAQFVMHEAMKYGVCTATIYHILDPEKAEAHKESSKKYFDKNWRKKPYPKKESKE
jgi:hypothetical protein